MTSQRRNFLLTIATASIVLVSFSAWFFLKYFQLAYPTQDLSGFSGERAYSDVEYQVSLGPRTPGSQGHEQINQWIKSALSKAGWVPLIQETSYQGHPVHNIIATQEGELSTSEWIILGTHYDTRFFADQDPDPEKRVEPVPGANDGASGVAVLLEIARVLPADLDKNIWLVFFDAEDNGNIPGWDWILGSNAFVAQLDGMPDAVVIVDMVGDADLNIYLERNSTPELSASIWASAAALGYSDRFIPIPRHRMLDDHTPFLRAGIPAVDIIDFDYPYWHTTADTPDKVSAESLQIVGETLIAWLSES